jgi:hypothetical protein
VVEDSCISLRAKSIQQEKSMAIYICFCSMVWQKMETDILFPFLKEKQKIEMTTAGRVASNALLIT